MSTGQYSLVKVAVDGDLITAADRNAEHQNAITHAEPDGIGGHSDTATEMRATIDPYPGAVESLATDLAGEIERLRYLIKQITGKTYWYQDPVNPSFSVHKNGTNQTGCTTGIHTKVTWSTELFDTNSNFAANAFTPTVAGKYLLTATVTLTTGVDTEYMVATMFKNGNAFCAGNKTHASGVHNISSLVSSIVDANGTTDYFEIYVFHEFGVDATIYGDAIDTYFSGCWVSP